jgi:hypothetical protein
MAEEKKLRYTYIRKGFYIDEDNQEVVDLKTIHDKGHDPKTTLLNLISISKPKEGKTAGTGGNLEKSKQEWEEAKKRLKAMKALSKKK